jgi:hypothetical protein
MKILCKYFRLVEFCWTLCPDAFAANQDVSVSAYMWSAASGKRKFGIHFSFFLKKAHLRPVLSNIFHDAQLALAAL